MIMDRLQWILCLMFCLTIIVCCLPLCEAEIVPIYYYKRYSYKKKQKNERKIKHLKSNCDAQCSKEYGLAESICSRRCMSEFCYQEMYGNDPLEEGEIDVRYTSFKGCILKSRTDL